jgi:hypothetical protein
MHFAPGTQTLLSSPEGILYTVIFPVVEMALSFLIRFLYVSLAGKKID